MMQRSLSLCSPKALCLFTAPSPGMPPLTFSGWFARKRHPERGSSHSQRLTTAQPWWQPCAQTLSVLTLLTS